MVLEIVGARYLQPWFGGAFYVWTSQIGVVMLALAAGYAVGGQLADRWKKARYLGALLIPAGLFILLIPAVAPSLLDAIVDRHAQVNSEVGLAGADANEPAEPAVVEVLQHLQVEILMEAEILAVAVILVVAVILAVAAIMVVVLEIQDTTMMYQQE